MKQVTVPEYLYKKISLLPRGKTIKGKLHLHSSSNGTVEVVASCKAAPLKCRLNMIAGQNGGKRKKGSRKCVFVNITKL